MARPTRIGVLVPSTNQVVEPDFAALVPPGVTFHTERLWNGDAWKDLDPLRQKTVSFR